MVEMFAKLGAGQWFRYLTGALEVIGAVALALMIALTVNWLKDGFPSRPQLVVTPQSGQAP